MTLRHGLFVANGTTGVTAPQDARLALAALLSGAGVVSGGTVSGNSSGPNMKYDVAAGAFATARLAAATDGLFLFANDGTVTVDSGTPAPASGSRWDLIWVRHKNANDGAADTNSDPEFGVKCGSAGSSPTKPYGSVPAGALVLAESSVGASITDATHAVITQVAALTTVAGVQGKYTDYVPRLTDLSTGAVITSTVSYARYTVIGKTVFCKGSVTANAANIAGHGIACDLPLAARERELVVGPAAIFLGTPPAQIGLGIVSSDLQRFSPMSSFGAGIPDIASGQVLRWRISYELP